MARLYGMDQTRAAVAAAYSAYAEFAISDEELAERLAAIAVEAGVELSEVEEYYYLHHLAVNGQDTAVVFYHEQDWLAGKPCLDWRCGSQMLPRGSVVVGMALRSGLGQLCLPYLPREEQRTQAEEVARAALDAVGLIDHNWQEGPLNWGRTCLVPTPR